MSMWNIVVIEKWQISCLPDPFNEPQERGASQEGLIHIRIQQRNGRKTLTTVQGISDDYDKKKLVKVCKKVMHLSWVSP